MKEQEIIDRYLERWKWRETTEGFCWRGRQTIDCPEDDVQQLVHEIAHALHGTDKDHIDPEFWAVQERLAKEVLDEPMSEYWEWVKEIYLS